MIEADHTILYYALQSTDYVNDDICNYINNSLHTRLYLNNMEYHYQPATAYIQPTPFTSKAYFKVKCDLEAVGLETWSPVVANGGLSNYRCFNCFHCYDDCLKLNEARASKDAANKKYRSESLINSDKGNRREDGKKLRRKTSSTRFDQKSVHLVFNSVGIIMVFIFIWNLTVAVKFTVGIQGTILKGSTFLQDYYQKKRKSHYII